LETFLTFLDGINLDEIILERFRPMLYDEKICQCKINTKSLKLNCTAITMNHLLRHHVYLDNLKSIELVHHLHPIRIRNYSNLMTDIFLIINENAKELQKISISLYDYFEGIQESNFTFPSSIEEIKFEVLIDIKNAIDLVNQIKFKNEQSNNFRFIELKILADCNKNEEVNKLRDIIKTLALRFGSLETIHIYLMCCHFNVEKCPFKLRYKIEHNQQIVFSDEDFVSSVKIFIF
jgi:hypothetical protein